MFVTVMTGHQQANRHFFEIFLIYFFVMRNNGVVSMYIEYKLWRKAL